MHNGIDLIYVEYLFKRAEGLRKQIGGHSSMLLNKRMKYIDQKSISLQIVVMKQELVEVESELYSWADYVCKQDEMLIQNLL